MNRRMPWPLQLRRASAPPRAGRRSAFTIVEIALVIVILAGLLAATAGAYRYTLTRARVADTRALLADLREAVQTLWQSDATSSSVLLDRENVFDALCAQPVTADILRDQSQHLWQCADGNARCVDAWGTRLRFITASGADAEMRRRLQLAGSDAIFESAGPDRDFGDTDMARRTDNLRSDEPSVNGE